VRRSLSFEAGFERRVRGSLRASGVAGGLIVAASGGADSTAALLALNALVTTGKVAVELRACYVDHGLRSNEERATELATLAQVCAGLGVELVVRRVDVEAARTRRHGSIEDAARRVRYAALGALAEELAAAAVVTGHTEDDQVETVLLRLLRGTGVRGLRGMSAVSRHWGEDGPLLLRPLLCTTRAETERYCRARGACWARDSSNALSRFRRNRVRHELLPLLREIAPGALGALLRLAGQAAALDDWINSEAQRVLDAVWTDDGLDRLLARPAQALHPALRAAVVRAVLVELIGPPGPPSERHVAALVELWTGARGRRLAVGYGWWATAEAGAVRFSRRAAEPLTDA
jgi:tRNA(Ile)-lysidine synthase